jgi:hypothetical protein
MVSWHPPHEANLNTPIRGFESHIARLSKVLLAEKPPNAVIAQDWAVFTNKVRAKLTLPAESDAALHVPLDREEELGGGEAAGEEFVGGIPHHDLGPAREHDGPVGSLRSHRERFRPIQVSLIWLQRGQSRC